MNLHDHHTDHHRDGHGPGPIAVIGAHGKTGRRIAARLIEAGHDVRPLSRSTAIRFDWDDPSTWAAALAGTSAMYVTFQPDLAVPGSRDATTKLADVAVAAGVGRAVLLSGRGEPEAPACEQILLTSAIPTTVLRCAFFAQNFSEHFLLGPVLDGMIALPAGAVAEPIVDADDIADAAVAALTQPGHAGRVYELTGPELLTFEAIATELSAALGRTVRYVDVPAAAYVGEAVEAGVPVEEAEMLAELFAHIFDGHNESLADGVAEVLGRPARSFRQFARDAVAAGSFDIDSDEVAS